MASRNGQLECVRTLLENGADINAKDKVRNQKNDDDGVNYSTNYDDDDNDDV